jgi:hypothetical protein
MPEDHQLPFLQTEFLKLKRTHESNLMAVPQPRGLNKSSRANFLI